MKHVSPTLVLLMFASLPAMLFGQTEIETLGKFGSPELMFDGFKFTEGPADDGQGNLYFTDIPANRIYQVTDGKKSVFVEPSLHCNGLMLDGDGQKHS